MGAWVYPTAGDNVLDKDVVKFVLFADKVFTSNTSLKNHKCHGKERRAKTTKSKKRLFIINELALVSFSRHLLL